MQERLKCRITGVVILIYCSPYSHTRGWYLCAVLIKARIKAFILGLVLIILYFFPFKFYYKFSMTDKHTRKTV